MTSKYQESPSEHGPVDERERIFSLSDFIAKILDSFFRIPGTNIRIGLDPLIGLLPMLGDVIANLIGSTILFLAVQLHVPKIIIFRMVINMSLNTVVGAIPGFGDLFSIWFRSNVKNAELLRRYTTEKKSFATISDWAYVIFLILLLLLITLGSFFLIVWGVHTIWNLDSKT